ncbi:MAG: hypothetical protein QOE90_3703 [Thermoplasmata archaeon]|jgi:predicted patatin/cPLA2 family phospholipase|nr:hypothetical protein [Thermoplasmata archaeon]
MVTLVLEGGAARATYGSGVCDALLRAGLVPEAIYGTSAGAAIGAWFASGQTEAGISTWDAIGERELLSFRRAFTRRPIIDFARLYGHMYPNRFGMDVARLRSAPFPVWVTLTDAERATSRYVDLRRAPDPFKVLHATSAMPIISEAPVVLEDGRPYVDGGMTDPIPLAKALADGHRDIIVVTNRVEGDRRPEPAFVVSLVGRRFPALRAATARHHAIQQEALALAAHPPEGARVRLVRPQRPLGISRLTRDVRKLRAAVETGRADGAALAREIGLLPKAAP